MENKLSPSHLLTPMYILFCLPREIILVWRSFTLFHGKHSQICFSCILGEISLLYTLVGLDVSLDTFVNEFICTKLPENSLERQTNTSDVIVVADKL